MTLLENFIGLWFLTKAVEVYLHSTPPEQVTWFLTEKRVYCSLHERQTLPLLTLK
jgi:hypothetical protein